MTSPLRRKGGNALRRASGILQVRVRACYLRRRNRALFDLQGFLLVRLVLSALHRLGKLLRSLNELWRNMQNIDAKASGDGTSPTFVLTYFVMEDLFR